MLLFIAAMLSSFYPQIKNKRYSIIATVLCIFECIIIFLLSHRYGKALLGLSREESGVLGDGVPGSGNADEEEEDNEGKH